MHHQIKTNYSFLLSVKSCICKLQMPPPAILLTTEKARIAAIWMCCSTNASNHSFIGCTYLARPRPQDKCRVGHSEGNEEALFTVLTLREMETKQQTGNLKCKYEICKRTQSSLAKMTQQTRACHQLRLRTSLSIFPAREILCP